MQPEASFSKPYRWTLWRLASTDCAPSSQDCRGRRRSRATPTTPLKGDANDPAHLDLACSLINPKSLVIAYLDPQKPNLHWTTVEYLARPFQYIDFIINLPFSGIHRALGAGGDERPRLMLGHPNPIELVAIEECRTAQNIRDYYDEQLLSLGLIHIARRCVHTTWSNSPLYDVVLASRHPTAVKLWEKANPAPKAVVQSSIFDLPA